MIVSFKKTIPASGLSVPDDDDDVAAAAAVAGAVVVNSVSSTLIDGLRTTETFRQIDHRKPSLNYVSTSLGTSLFSNTNQAKKKQTYEGVTHLPPLHLNVADVERRRRLRNVVVDDVWRNHSDRCQRRSVETNSKDRIQTKLRRRDRYRSSIVRARGGVDARLHE